YAVPLGAYLVMATFSGTPLFTRRPDGARPRWASRRTLLTLAACVVLGSASVYYAGFTVVLLLAAAVVALLARRDGRALKGALGVVAAIGFLWLVLVALLSLVASARRMSIDERFRHASAGALIAFLLATVGGVSTLINYWITPQLRAWNRISVFIAFFSLVAVALLLDRLRRRVGPSPGRRLLFGLWPAA